MKKLISLLLAVIASLSILTAHAESSFTLRNDIHFGEDLQTVVAKETWAPIEGTHFYNYAGELLGLPSMVMYNFKKETDSNPQKELMSAKYCINTVYDEEGKTHYSRESCFSMLCLSLKMKYGDPLKNPESVKTLEDDPIIQFYTLWLASAAVKKQADFESISTDNSRAVWVIPEKGRNVVIEAQEYELIQDGEKCFLTLLSYSAYTDEYLQDVRAELASITAGL